MKTSLIIDDRLFEKAQKVAQKEKKTLSEVISHWARVGLDQLQSQNKKKKGAKFPSFDLGKPLVDLDSRKDWADLVYDRD